MLHGLCIAVERGTIENAEKSRCWKIDYRNAYQEWDAASMEDESEYDEGTWNIWASTGQ
jgi:hypothetical protein